MPTSVKKLECRMKKRTGVKTTGIPVSLGLSTVPVLLGKTATDADRTRIGRGLHDRIQRNGRGPDAGTAVSSYLFLHRETDFVGAGQLVFMAGRAWSSTSSERSASLPTCTALACRI
eukprot:gene14816-biopygen3621